MSNSQLCRERKATKIIIFQQNGSGEEKIAGIKEFGTDLEISKVFNIDLALPELIDEPEEYLSENFSGDLVLCFLKHPDLIDHLVSICQKKKIPVIAAGKKHQGAISPFTCCGLGRHSGLGAYGEQFGFPELEISLEENLIKGITIKRGASCGATWHAAPEIIGLTTEEALVSYARAVQYLCTANPAAFDPITGKSALHYAGDVHAAALKKALTGK
ncbi:MAG: DUF166 domain-containing protein [Proteobacteria bacterium]|nr:DUF166 domain-containing protein [Pseudomonadota bacterium]MBU1714559.1 DUF166 domain-containing protein [Pseudomonadota bacterium]